ncbi:hypothetical protein [Rhizorhabdus wittichii]|jgi:hypothetical protein|uniref:Uncharacterized protein n=2 Tax=Rhizorhabdus wittichii TaxID=160791 RepID=A0A9J9LAI4_RHIWR|nr:hypothetical protein [Rhizorhabdus wittichii]ABQ66422.1 hypothetical protein Swit_0049 [Rhizorhabdus wittichii RW1]ARR56953.1 hypothetical protein HY78_27690 [Rhizorhabdus wittichii DC-6]QTH22342.1 hypothetical protein HRJ34_02075 [Rhizorhabdus wittichii]
MMNGPAALTLSLLMLGGLVLGIGGLWMIVRRGDPKRGWLMIAAAVVMFANVAIWTMPLR